MREKFKRFCDTANPDLLRLVIIFVLVGLLLAGFLLFGRSGNENSVMPAWEQAEHVEPPDERLAAAQKENPGRKTRTFMFRWQMKSWRTRFSVCGSAMQTMIPIVFRLTRTMQHFSKFWTRLLPAVRSTTVWT